MDLPLAEDLRRIIADVRKSEPDALLEARARADVEKGYADLVAGLRAGDPQVLSEFREAVEIGLSLSAGPATPDAGG